MALLRVRLLADQAALSACLPAPVGLPQVSDAQLLGMLEKVNEQLPKTGITVRGRVHGCMPSGVHALTHPMPDACRSTAAARRCSKTIDSSIFQRTRAVKSDVVPHTLRPYTCAAAETVRACVL